MISSYRQECSGRVKEMKKLIILLCTLFAVLLAACGNDEASDYRLEKTDIEVNTVEGISMELMPGHTDRRSAVVVTNGIRFSRYCSDVSKWEVHRLEKP